jgi:5-methylcytosine-specific restriction endonuclease McrA
VKTLEQRRRHERAWKLNNPGKKTAHVAKRQATKIQATPKWLSKQQLLEIREFYIIAKELQWLSEEPLQVDHIMPLRGKDSCGLHVPWNLQILPRNINIRKGNRV